jgi:hypothetical protein
MGPNLDGLIPASQWACDAGTMCSQTVPSSLPLAIGRWGNGSLRQKQPLCNWWSHLIEMIGGFHEQSENGLRIVKGLCSGLD